jgi:hypothetical protein
MDDKVISLHKERENRLVLGKQVKQSLWTRLIDYSSNAFNLRDKVRAKHLFCQRLGLEPEQLLESFWQGHLQAWMVLEYRNIKKERAIDLFLKEHRSELSDAKWMMLGQFMATYLSVYEVKRVDTQLELIDIFSQAAIYVPIEREYDNSLAQVEEQMTSSQLLIGRLIRVGPSYGLLEPYHLTHSFAWDVERQIRSEYESFKKSNAVSSWRPFMQQNGIGVLTGCKSGPSSSEKIGSKGRRKND